MDFDWCNIKGVIFDLDETIISSIEAYTEAFNRGTKDFGLEPVTVEIVARFLDEGYRLSKMLLELFPSVFQDDRKRQLCEDRIRKAYGELEPQRVLLKPDVKPTLRSLKKQGCKIGIVTGRMTKGENKWRELNRLNIRHFIDAMVTAAEAPAKPAPDGLIKCVKELGLFTKECVFVGDSRIDVIAGKAAEVRTIAIYAGVANKELLTEQRPDCVLPDLSSLSLCLFEMQKIKEDLSGRIRRII